MYGSVRGHNNSSPNFASLSSNYYVIAFLMKLIMKTLKEWG
jgi:hypothetical protein